jgi:hypothetical protein
MSESSVAPARIVERYIRVCVDHGRPLCERGDALICPVRSHRVRRWVVLDRQKARTVDERYRKERTRSKRSAAQKAAWARPETRAKLSAAMARPETRAKLSAAQKAKKGMAA